MSDVHREPHEPHAWMPRNDLARVVARRVVDDDDLRPVRASLCDELKQDGQVAGRIPVDREIVAHLARATKPPARAASQRGDQVAHKHAPEHAGGESARNE